MPLDETEDTIIKVEGKISQVCYCQTVVYEELQKSVVYGNLMQLLATKMLGTKLP